MNLEIRELTPNLAEDFARFFDVTPHYGNDETKCYCITWCGDNVYDNGGGYWYPSPEERRIHAIQRIHDGDLQGYLAYYNDKIVGWCNANTKSDCLGCMNYLRTDAGVPLEECRHGEKIKFVFCFVVAPEMQRKGIATQLLKYICQDAAANGFDFVEAYVNEKFSGAVHEYRGAMAMYEKCGFNKWAEHEGKAVVRKALK
ncbi:MAG: GNAT family N-acetyltransferase [Firmicutes bacterium]|nr:GNAT family N-acetyltransferase [Bacillota bacterium]